MGLEVLNGSILGCADPSVLIMPLREEETDGQLRKLREITIDEA